jgi:hypothetical protein
VTDPDLRAEEPGDDPVGTVPRRHLALVALAVALGTAAVLWVSAAIAFVIDSRPDRAGGPLFSIPGATLQMVVAAGGAIALMGLAVKLGDRATGGSGPWVRRDLLAWSAGLLALWIVLALLRP